MTDEKKVSLAEAIAALMERAEETGDTEKARLVRRYLRLAKESC